LFQEEEPIFASLEAPLPFYYTELAGKHIEARKQRAALISISARQAVMEAAAPLSLYANILLQPADGPQQEEELYAKVVRAVDESSRRYLIHFTSVPSGIRAWLYQLLQDRGMIR
jgi:hypothetical protein